MFGKHNHTQRTTWHSSIRLKPQTEKYQIKIISNQNENILSLGREEWSARLKTRRETRELVGEEGSSWAR
ncbi:hypothetical protein QVD17_18487 [Tagetes erecta]|uniref:Uncharacterized protein n=1 Tax=Tagetes erecta TaxID=13708 RepID=A0AAD8KMX0_TARER|nr:hypothetical protein QVD17_18487 [Tagetes erecta]